MNKIIAVIPARGGSKGVPKKNILDVKGYPLIAYSIIGAKLSQYIERVIISTDSEEIAEIAKKYGAEVPFLRPVEYASDKALDIDWVKHAIYWLRAKENFIPELLIHLRPTTPLREVEYINQAIEMIQKDETATSLRSAHKMNEHPFKCFMLSQDKYWAGLLPKDEKVPEYYNLPRQSYPDAYQPNGYVDILKPEYILKTDLLHGDKILAFITKKVIELDDYEDYLEIKHHITKSNKLYKSLKLNNL